MIFCPSPVFLYVVREASCGGLRFFCSSSVPTHAHMLQVSAVAGPSLCSSWPQGHLEALRALGPTSPWRSWSHCSCWHSDLVLCLQARPAQGSGLPQRAHWELRAYPHRGQADKEIGWAVIQCRAQSGQCVDQQPHYRWWASSVLFPFPTFIYPSSSFSLSLVISLHVSQ